MGMSSDNIRGLALAVSSTIFLGSSAIIKKHGLKISGATSTSAGQGGHSYLYEPWWWAGMMTMIVGEIANFAAYAYAPAILVTPSGALSIIVRRNYTCSVCSDVALCVVGSTTIVLHAPQERNIESVKELWQLATKPGFLVYACLVVIVVAVLIFRYVPRYGQNHVIVYVGICSLTGSHTVMSVKALGIGLKLSFEGKNQFKYYETWVFALVVIFCCLLQVNYLNKAVDTFDIAVVSPVYYVMFTTFTIFASIIMFKDWGSQSATDIASELCGFVTILSGIFLLQKTKDAGESSSTRNPTFNSSELNPTLNSNCV